MIVVILIQLDTVFHADFVKLFCALAGFKSDFSKFPMGPMVQINK